MLPARFMKQSFALAVVTLALLAAAALMLRRHADTGPAAVAPPRPPPVIVRHAPDMSLPVVTSARAHLLLKPAPEPQPVPADIHAVLDMEAAYAARREKLAGITGLSAPECQAAVGAYLREPLPYANAGWWEDEYDLRNNLLNLLRENYADAREVTDTLLAIYNNPDQGDILRCYALQYIGGWLNTGPLSAADRERLLDAVRDAAAQVDNPALGGTALIAMREGGPQDETGELALRALRAERACPETRISAFQICAELGLQEALGPARAALADTAAPVIMRMSAVNLLAATGGPDDIRLLRAMSAAGPVAVHARSAHATKAVFSGAEELVRNAARLALASRNDKGK